ncbi:unnamed protein product, partial [Staurois parvus]
MGTDRWHGWGYTDHQGTLISALMISVHVPSEYTDRSTACPRGCARAVYS